MLNSTLGCEKAMVSWWNDTVSICIIKVHIEKRGVLWDLLKI